MHRWAGWHVSRTVRWSMGRRAMVGRAMVRRAMVGAMGVAMGRRAMRVAVGRRTMGRAVGRRAVGMHARWWHVRWHCRSSWAHWRYHTSRSLRGKAWSLVIGESRTVPVTVPMGRRLEWSCRSFSNSSLPLSDFPVNCPAFQLFLFRQLLKLAVLFLASVFLIFPEFL